jgi:hypothetical protein
MLYLAVGLFSWLFYCVTAVCVCVVVVTCVITALPLCCLLKALLSMHSACSRHGCGLRAVVVVQLPSHCTSFCCCSTERWYGASAV